MKGLFRALLPTLLLLAIIMALAGCIGERPDESTVESTSAECASHSFGDGEITKAPGCGSEGVRTYTCSICGKTKVESIPATGEHQFGEDFEIIENATCDKAGLKRFTCSVCGATHDEEIPTAEAHIFDEGVVTIQPTCYEEGVRTLTCTLCGFTSEEVEPIAEPVYIVRLEGFGEYLVSESGAYKLEDPEKVGYEFVKWVDSEGNDFPAEGTVSDSVTVIPVFSLLDTKTVEELEERAAGGADVIKIVNDIVIDRPIFVTGSTRIYSEKAVKLIRDKNYLGDMFVIGMDKDGNNSLLMCLTPELTLGSEDYEGDEILLTIDGNRGNMSEGKEVVGTALFLINSAKVNMYNGVSVSNHQKLGNERLLTVESFQFKTASTVGGAAAMISAGSAFYMYGGIMENNGARTVAATDEKGTTAYFSGYGGAVYNNGTFRMLGGVIKNCEANRGGAVYSNKIVKIEAGLLEGNYASNKGGALCSSGADGVDIYIGVADAAAETVIFRGNIAAKQGGAILSYADSPIVLFGGVLFDSNAALGSNGGAISTSGPVTSYNNKFVNNTAKYSGGAIYQSYVSAEHLVRIVELHDTVFEGNSANKGGAVMLTSSADGEVGSSAKIYDCRFVGNTAKAYFTEKTDSETGEVKVSISGGNGGAIYSSQRSSFYIENCEFEENKSENLGGGAIGATVSSKITVNNSIFKNNSSVDVNGLEGGRSGVGGAIYAYNGTSLTVNGSTFDGNSAFKNGGALYLSDNTVKLNNVEFIGNSAGLNGGAIVQLSGNILEIRGISAYGNSAASGGGVIYNSKSTLSIIGGKDYQNVFGAIGEDDEQTAALANTAANGGALCAGNASIMNIGGASFVNNSANPIITEIYDEITGEVVGTKASEGYGGVIYAVYGSQVKVKDSDFASNSAKYGGVFSLSSDTTVLDVDNASLESNSSTNCGGVLYALSASASLNDVEMKGNVSAKGGALYLSSKSYTTVEDSVMSENAASLGGAVYASGSETASFYNVDFNTNGICGDKETKSGGAIYIISATVDVDDCSFDGNAATSGGGAIYLAATEKKVDSEGVETKTRIAALNSTDTTFKNNTARNGGAISASTDSTVALDRVELAGNSALGSESSSDARGGAIYMLGATLTADEVEFIGNHADYYGGAIDAHTGSVGELNDVRFVENSSLNNGGAIWMYTNTRIDITGIYAGGNTSGSAGGFVYTRGELNIHADEEFGSTFEGVAEGGETLTNAKNGGAFYCGASSNVVLEDVKLEGLNASGGGAIYVVGELSAKGCEFIGNTAKSGGAVYIESFAELDSCSFLGNGASSGGAVCVEGRATILGGAFEGNTASYRGGAVFVLNEETQTGEDKVTIDKASFTSNKATEGGTNEERRGGAIYVSEYVTVSVSNSIFNENAATQYGGAIDVARGSAIKLYECDFFKNSAEANGGAIWTYVGTKVELSGGEFVENVAAAYGGAIYFYGEMKATGTSFTKNTAKQGGALYATSGSVAPIENCSFSENSANYGGAFYAYGSSNVEFSNTMFEKNGAVRGGAGYVDGGTVSADKSEFNTNVAATVEGINTDARAGAVFVNSGRLNATDVKFNNNTADLNGGAIVMNSGSDGVIAEAELENVEFIGNVAKGLNGGAVWMNTDSVVNVTGIVAKANKAENGAGGVFYVTRSKLNILSGEGVINVLGGDGEGDGNVSESGGAIAGVGSSEIRLTGTSFICNSADEGGAIYTSSKVDAEGCIFNGNSASYGGAVCVKENAVFSDGTDVVDGETVIERVPSVFDGNTAKYGGAIYLYRVEDPENNPDHVAAKAYLEGTEFKSNVASSYGGACYLSSGAALDGDGLKLELNQANRGGAIYVSGGQLDINGSEFNANLALTPAEGGDTARGGAIFTQSGVANVIGVKFEGNIADNNAGAIVANSANAKYYLEKVEFVGNISSAGNGGAIWLYGGATVDIKGIIAKGNKAEKGVGGVVYITNGNLTVLSGDGVVNTFGGELEGEGNVAEQGGAIGGAGIAVINGASFIGNSADFGGAIYTSVTANSENCTFTNNVARYYGGAVCVKENANYSDNSSVFGDNTAKNGGAIFLYKVEDPNENPDHKAAEATVVGSVFTGNTASSSGGAIYLGTDASLNTQGADFTSNSSAEGGAIYLSGGSVYTDNSSELTLNIATTGEGGAIHSNGSLKLTGTKLVQNKTEAESKRGGAIYLTSGYIETDGVTFDGNAAVYSGGAIVITGAERAYFSNTIFKNNTSAYRGGAIYATNTADVRTVSCEFISNMAVNRGGAVYTTTTAQYVDGDAQIENSYSVFKSNGSVVGGALFADKAATLNGTVFEGNSAVSVIATTPANGGAVASTGGAIVINGASFIGNVAEQGGAIYGEKKVTYTVSGSIFKENTATNGGAIYGAKVEAVDCSFISNSATENGGAVYVAENSSFNYTASEMLTFMEGVADANYAGSKFDGNIAVNGAAIYIAVAETEGAAAGQATVTGATVMNNAATGNGGAIYANGTLKTVGAVFYKNSAENRGGAICVNRPYVDNGSLFVENTAIGEGGAIRATDGITIENTEFISNKSTGNRAGALYLTDGKLNALGVLFDGNEASTNGGAVVLTGADTSVFDGCTFTGNIAGGNAGAVHAHNSGLVTTLSCTFTDNVGADGGAVYNTGSAPYVDGSADDSTKGSTFTTNNADNGGAICSAGSVTLYGTKLNKNTAKLGGAIYTSGKLESNDCTFTENTVTGRGGAVYVSNEETLSEEIKASFNGSIFNSNKATTGVDGADCRGGAIYVAEFVNVIVSECSFNENAVTKYGGAIDVARGSVLGITDSDFVGNSAGSNGGAIWSYTGSVITISGGEFKNNVTNANGGAIFSYNITAIDGTAFISNEAKLGGAICVNGGATTTKNSIFTSNTATSGGAIYVAKGTYTDGELILDGENVIGAENGSTFSENIADNGGAVYVAGGVANAYDSILENNSVKTSVEETTDAETGAVTSVTTYLGNGGAVYVAAGATYNDRNATYNGNASALGGAIYTLGGTVNSTDSTFIENAAITSETTVTGADSAETTIAYGKGGAVHVAENGIFNYIANEKLTFIDGVADANYAGPKLDGNLAVNGAAIYIAAAETEGASAGTATVIGATIMNHNTTGNGGAIFANGVLNTAGAVIYKNSTENQAGAIATNKAYTDNGSLFVENTAVGEGGAIRAGSNITLENTKFISNKSTGNRAGAVLVTSGSLNAKNVTFEYNDAYRAGGAVTLTGAEESVFESCTFTGNVDQTYRGGAIYMHNSGLVTTLSCTFTSNSGKAGGAIYGTSTASYTDGSADGNNGSTFIGNTSQTAGGAIYILGECHLYGTNFENNTATTNGGAIYTGTTLTINNATFSGNKAADFGGAICVNGGATTTKNSIFTSNTATSGGAIYVAKGTYTDGELILDGENVIGAENGSTFSENIADNGGAVYVAGGVANAYDSILENNSVKTSVEETTDAETGAVTGVKTYLGNGGAVYVAAGATYNDRNATYNGNASALGGAIYTLGGTVNSTDSTFTENAAITSETTVTGADSAETTVAYGKGGAVHVAENGKFNYTANEKLTFIDGVADANYAGPKFDGNLAVNGAAIYIAAAETDGASAGSINVIGATFVNHSTTGSGGTIYFGSKSVDNVINNTVFYKNSSDVYGAAISIYDGVSVVSDGLIFVENTANRGGAVFMEGGSFTISNSEFIKNVAEVPEGKTTTARAGAIFAQKGTVTASNVKFIENTAESHGGAIVANSVNAIFYLENVEFIGNVSEGGNAGAIWLYSNATVEITGIIAKGNKAEAGYGGFAYLSSGTLSILSDDGVVNIFGGELEGEGNVAKNGGAIGSAGTINVNGASFIGNSATTNGGAIYVNGAATVIGSTFTSNNAENGGAIYAAKAMTVNNSTFNNNTATYGGAIYSKADLTCEDCDFEGNSTTEGGGAIYITGGVQLVVTGGTMKENKTASGKSGGAIAAYEDDSKASPTCYISGTTFDGNFSYSGGAICLRNTGTTKTEHVLENITLTNNQGGNGTIYIYNNTKVTVSGLVATNNTATQRGSVFYVTSSNAPTLILKDAQVSGNVVKSAIDIIHIANKTAVVEVYMDKISGDDFVAAGITDTTDITATGWDKLINNASSGTVTGYTTPVDDGNGVSAE